LSILFFALGTVPDVAGLRVLHGLPAPLADFEVIEYALQKQRAVGELGELPAHLQRIAHIAWIRSEAPQFALHSVAEAGQGEAALLQQFLDVLGEDALDAPEHAMPILHCRALVSAARLPASWSAHLPASAHSAPARLPRVPLHELSSLCGLALPAALSEDARIRASLAGEFDLIRRDCEARVLGRYFIFLREQHMRGQLDAAAYEQALLSLRAALA
jgi:3'-5' exonuclease